MQQFWMTTLPFSKKLALNKEQQQPRPKRKK
jgi:hypothetical protein